MADGARKRLLISATALMCERGVHATGLSDLLAHSKTARGSIYQHFPGGKSELMEQATYAAGRTITRLLDDLLATRDVADALDGIIDYWKGVLTESDYVMGCPILAAAEAGPREPAVQAASAVAFASWVDRIGAALAKAGAKPTTARRIASAAVSAIEGAIAQSRSARTLEPLDDTGTTLHYLVKLATSTGETTST